MGSTTTWLPLEDASLGAYRFQVGFHSRRVGKRKVVGVQLINHAASLVPQFLALGAISVTLNTMADIAVVLAAGRLARRLNSSILWQRRQRLVSGGALVGLGGYVAVS